MSDQPATMDNDLGLSVDMLDVDRLRDWARLLLTHGADIGHWGSVPHVAGKMQIMATGLERAVRDIGELRGQLAATHAAIRALRDEMLGTYAAGQSGGGVYWAERLDRLIGDPAQEPK